MERQYETVDNAHLECRTYNHGWTRLAIEEVDSTSWGLNLQCVRCGTVRKDLIERSGGLKSRKYAYAPGYVRPGVGKAKRSDFRVEFHYRIFTDHTEMELTA